MRRDRDQRAASAGAVGQQLERALNEIKAIRFRAIGRRASDRTGNGFRRRASDYEGAGNDSLADQSSPPPTKLIMAATLGAILGGCVIAILFLLLK